MKNKPLSLSLLQLWLKRYIKGLLIGVWFVLFNFRDELEIALVAFALLLAVATTLFMLFEYTLEKFNRRK